MSRSRLTHRQRLVAGLTPFLLALGAIPLLAPTCGGSGGKQTFARGSLIIPMDMCYQNQTDGVSTTPFSCPQAADPGNVIRAYGLVYQLVRNNIAVYWVIAPGKASLTAPDLTIQYTGGAPVLFYDWSAGGTLTSPLPTSGTSVTYIGGPFVVDGSDFARASAVLQSYKSLYSGVNVHVSNVAFTADVAKTMAGGWSAGGTVPPKLALLDIGSSGAGTKNSEVVIQGYLTQAGLDFPGASGTATGTHGQIYDKLLMEDFFPDATGNPATSNLFKNGYQVLWVPHWAAPSSCSDCTGTSCTCSVKYTAAQVDSALRTMGAFSVSGHDVFAECAGLGSFEGVASDPNTYRTGALDASTHFQTTAAAAAAGLSAINQGGSAAYFWPGNFSSPLLQLGDFVFRPAGGAIADFTSSLYKTETKRLISHGGTATDYDVFTIDPVSAAHGTIVYLGGHSYSGTDGTFQIAGSRLVLNTLFNLGAGCVSSGVACNTGKLGVCAAGTMQCDPKTGLPVCVQTTAPSPEICDGLDNDCNGLVDDGLDVGCYDGPAATRSKGICHDGVSSCVKRADGTYGMSACLGEVLPSPEVCNGLDDDCNGVVDDAPATAGSPPNPANSLTQACYTGPASSLDPVTGVPRGICKAGVSTCASGGVWSACGICAETTTPLPWVSPGSYTTCQILPHTEDCAVGPGGIQYDMNCNGIVADGCGCTPGAKQSCYRGPAGTLGNGPCNVGTQICVAGTPNAWGTCSGDVLPGQPDCTKPPASPPADANCNGVADYLEAVCNQCPPAGDPSLVCYTGPAGTAGVGLCKTGVRSCSNGVLGTACAGQILPSPEVCDGKDNNCNGLVDDGATCPAGQSCVNGACVPAACGVERPCPEGYSCSATGITTGQCVLAPCGASVSCSTTSPCPSPMVCGAGGFCECAPGAVCRFGLCTDPCTGVTCGAGAVCASGTCTAGGCYTTGCPTGQLCRGGACVNDPCVGTIGDTCPTGTFCRAGDCVQSCVFQRCAAGQRCGADGFCVADPCAGVSCAPDRICSSGTCVANPCVGLSCGPGLVCQNGACVDDPCSGVRCPVGQCVAGQCYSTENPLGLGASSQSSGKSSGCGCGSGAGSASSALLLLAALPLARRRRTRGGGGGLLLGVLAAVIALAGTACKHSDGGFDPSQCQQTCGEQRCVDLRSDPVHCGACATSCAAGQICVDGACGPGGPIAPYVASVSPTSAPKGAVTPIALTGERFQAGATVRVIAPSGTSTAAATVTDASHLTASLDFTASPTTSVSLRVVNPDRVISNSVQLDVVSPTPIITNVTANPTPVKSGQASVLTVTGSGFVATSKCHVKGPSVTDLALPTTVGATLACTFDATGVSPGSWELWVVNEGILASNHWPFTVSGSGAPTLTSISPSAAAPSTAVSMSLTGTGFDASAAVVATPSIPGLTTAVFNPATPSTLTATFTAPACSTSACSYAIAVTTSLGTSSSQTFTVSAGVPQVTGLAVAPSPPYQGDTVTLTFSGTSLSTATGATIQPPTGPSFPATATATPAVVTANLATACGATPCPAGLYAATLVFSGGGTSSSFPFRVFSNVAVLQSATPAGGAQGATVTSTLSGSNFRGASGSILFQGPAGFSRTLPSATWTAPNSATVSLALAGLDTGVYSLAVVNPGAQPSNAVSFTVTPGPPTLATVSPPSVSQATPPPVLVTLTGTNFAKPDANGNAASQVMVLPSRPAWAPSTAYAAGAFVLNGDNAYQCILGGTSAASGGPTGTGTAINDGTVIWAWAGTWTPLPAGNAVTVSSSTSIAISFDSRTAVPGTTYLIQVWNPPGPQKSGSVTFTVSP